MNFSILFGSNSRMRLILLIKPHILYLAVRL